LRLRLGIVTTHPIQYQVPWFRALALHPEIGLKVLYCMIPDAAQQGDGFGVKFQWDQPLLGGYEHEILDNVSREPSVTRFSGCDCPGVGAAIRRNRFDAVIVNGWVVKACLQALWACRRQGVPCVVRGESNDLRRRKPWVRLAHRLLLSQYAAFLAIGKANKRFYLANGVRPERIFHCPYGVDNAWFGQQADTLRPMRDELRRAWGIPPAATVFLFCAKMIPKKRPLDFIEALAQAARRAAPGRVWGLVAGDGELRGECERLAGSKGAPVTFAGFLNQGGIPRAYAASDCLVLPSDAGETWGLVVNEAMACGLPALVSDHAGCAEDLVIPDRTGFVFPLGGVAAMAERMALLAGAPQDLLRMGAEAQRHVAGYGVDAMAAGAVDALEWLAHRRTTRRHEPASAP